MIVILYPVGGFGSTIEYCLKNFSQEHGPLSGGNLTHSGSMHHYEKEYHVHLFDQFKLDIRSQSDLILNSVYPLRATLNQPVDQELITAKGSVHLHKKYILKNDHVIFVKLNDIKDVEISYLMRYEKLPKADLVSSITVESCQAWQPTATSVLDLDTWQLRELLSIQFNDSLNDLLTIDTVTEKNWMIVEFNDILTKLPDVISNSLDYIGWTKNNEDLVEFSKQWQQRQQTIVNRLQQINEIVTATLSDKHLSWSEPQLIDQVLIQARLLRQGYEIKCDGLNSFPTNSTDLKKLLIKT